MTPPANSPANFLDETPLGLLQREGASSVVPLRWEEGVLRLLDQRLLPHREVWLAYRTAREAAGAIKEMVVRGAPAIGITAAFAMALAARAARREDRPGFDGIWQEEAAILAAARPTAVNLRWAVRRLTAVIEGRPGTEPEELAALVEREALAVWMEDIRANLAMGAYGQALLPATGGVLTHCNAGALATGGYGTALGVIRAAARGGKAIRVLAGETRPWLQGARLTAWELLRDGIPVDLIVDSAAGFLMQRGEIQAVIVGADRIAANGDVANKIGTYSLARLAAAHNIPFYVAAPLSTLDILTPSGSAIPIEERGAAEITSCAGHPVAAPGAGARNPVFDVTPAQLVTAIITERGMLSPPYGPSIHACLS